MINEYYFSKNELKVVYVDGHNKDKRTSTLLSKILQLKEPFCFQFGLHYKIRHLKTSTNLFLRQFFTCSHHSSILKIQEKRK